MKFGLLIVLPLVEGNALLFLACMFFDKKADELQARIEPVFSGVSNAGVL